MTRSILTLDDAQAQAAGFIEARRARHGALRMEDTGKDGAPADDAGTGDDGTDGAPPESVEDKLARLEAELATTKQHARKHEDRAKANKAAAEELARLKASTATDEEKLAAAQRLADESRRELAKYRVAADTGVPADLITGDDEDAMRAFAEALKAFRGERTETKPGPKPDPSQGPKGPVKKSAAEQARADYERRHPTKKN